MTDQSRRAEYIANVTRTDGDGFSVSLMNILTAVLGWFSVSVEVFLRHSFGERYLSVTRLVLGLIAFLLVVFSRQIIAVLTPPGTLSVPIVDLAAFLVLYLAFLGFGIFQLWRIWQRNRRGMPWYSKSFGISRFSSLVGKKIGPLAIDDWTLYRFIEPGFVLLMAIILGFLVSDNIRNWLLLIFVTMLVRNNFLHSRERGRILDMMDAAIIGRFGLEALKGEDKHETAGLSIVRPPRGADADRDGIPDFLDKIKPAARAAPAGAAKANKLDFGDWMSETVSERVTTASEGSAPPATAESSKTASHRSTAVHLPANSPEKPTEKSPAQSEKKSRNPR